MCFARTRWLTMWLPLVFPRELQNHRLHTLQLMRAAVSMKMGARARMRMRMRARVRARMRMGMRMRMRARVRARMRMGMRMRRIMHLTRVAGSWMPQ